MFEFEMHNKWICGWAFTLDPAGEFTTLPQTL